MRDFAVFFLKSRVSLTRSYCRCSFNWLDSPFIWWAYLIFSASFSAVKEKAFPASVSRVEADSWFPLVWNKQAHLVICTHSDLSCLHFLFQVNTVQHFRLPFGKKEKKKKKSFVIYIFIQRVGFIFLLCIEDNYSSFFLFVFPSGSVRISKTVDLHLCGGFHACFSKEQHSIARQKNSIGTTEKHPIPFTSMPSVSVLGRCYRTKGLNARVHEKEEGLNGCLLINNENSLTL